MVAGSRRERRKGWVEIRGLVAGNPGSSEPTSQLSRICIQIALFSAFFFSCFFEQVITTRCASERASERKEGSCVSSRFAIVSRGPRRKTALFTESLAKKLLELIRWIQRGKRRLISREQS